MKEEIQRKRYVTNEERGRAKEKKKNALHLSNPLVHIRVGAQLAQLVGRQLQQAHVALLRRDLRAHRHHLLLRRGRLAFNLVDNLYFFC